MFQTDIWKAYYYMYINPTLNCNELERAFCHYMTSGRHNGNLLFDWKFYVQTNALPFRSLETALSHYLKTGILKNFITHNLKSLEEVVNSFFDWRYYVSTYSLSGITCREAAIDHWRCRGKSLGYRYNAYTGTLPPDATAVNTTKYITDTADNIIIRHDNTVTIKNVGHALTNILRDTYSTLLQRLLLLKIELIRIASDLSFRNVTRRQRVSVNTYINEIAHVVKTTRYGEKSLFVENSKGDNTVELVSENTNIIIHPQSDYNFNRSIDYVLYARETPTFRALEAGERAVFNSTWNELRVRINRNELLINNLNDEIIIYKTYITDTIKKLETRLELVNTIFGNMKKLLPGYGEERIGNDKLVNILKNQFEVYKRRHEEFIEFLNTDKNSQCYIAFNDSLEISTTPFNNIIVELNDLANSCTNGLIGNVVFSIDNLESSLDMYRKSNAETVENIHENRKLVKTTKNSVTDLLKNYTNSDLSADIIVENYNRLQQWKVALESDINNSTALHSKNSTIQNVIDLFTNIRIRGSVTDEIVTEHLRRKTREQNIDEITASIKTALEHLRLQALIVDELPNLLKRIREQSSIILYDTIFNRNFFTWECHIEALDRIETVHSDRSLGRHVIRLPYGIALDVKHFNPISYGINKPIVIRASRPKWRSIEVYCADRLQYSINVDNMNLNVNNDTIKLNTFRDVSNSIRTVDSSVEQLIANLKSLRDSRSRY